MISRRGICLIVLVLLMSCSGRQTEGRILEEDQMGAVLFDLLQADAFSENFLRKDTLTRNSQTARLQQQVFSIHGITRADFEASYRHYSEEPRRMSRVLDSLLSRSERSRSQMMMERFSGKQIASPQPGE